ncbi:MAG: hypothetical protein WBX15_14050 [Thermoanaerobaculia bacterium]
MDDPRREKLGWANEEVLRGAYGTLLEAREVMIESLVRRGCDRDSREIFVDSLIVGVVGHLHEVASRMELYAGKVEAEGGFGSYATNLCDQIVSMVIELDPTLRRDDDVANLLRFRRG